MISYKLILYYEQINGGDMIVTVEYYFDNYEDAYNYGIIHYAYSFEIFKLEKKKDHTSKTLEIRHRKWLPRWFTEWQVKS